MIYADKLIDIIKVLEEGGLVLMPTDTLWSIATSLNSEIGFSKLNALLPLSTYPIVVVKELDEIKQFIPRLHPRVETLMSIYERPLTIVKPNVGSIATKIPSCNANKIGFHVTMDDFTKRIIELLGNPLLIYKIPSLHHSNQQKFNDLPLQSLVDISYICKHRQEDALEDGVAAGYDSEGNLTFE